MKLLIITQKVDIHDPILGFFHRWIAEFAKSFESLTVICLQRGEYNLPENVKVFSLGKEKKPSRFSYILNFYKYIWRERKNYDAVFVHMNQEYVLLGGLVWKLLGKRIYLWRNHPNGNFLTKLAVGLARKVFCTSQYSYTARFKKTKIMPVGIDTTFFLKNSASARKQNSLLFFGRVSPVKKVEIFIEACRLLKERGVNFSADIVGDSSFSDRSYQDDLKRLVEKAGLGRLVIFKPAVSNNEAPNLYNQYDIYVNTTPTGSFDKTILEALACETLIVTSNRALRGLVDGQFIFNEGVPSHLADKLSAILDWPEAKKIGEGILGREKVKTTHDLSLLAKNVAKEIS